MTATLIFYYLYIIYSLLFFQSIIKYLLDKAAGDLPTTSESDDTIASVQHINSRTDVKELQLTSNPGIVKKVRFVHTVFLLCGGAKGVERWNSNTSSRKYIYNIFNSVVKQF